MDIKRSKWQKSSLKRSSMLKGLLTKLRWGCWGIRMTIWLNKIGHLYNSIMTWWWIKLLFYKNYPSSSSHMMRRPNTIRILLEDRKRSRENMPVWISTYRSTSQELYWKSIYFGLIRLERMTRSMHWSENWKKCSNYQSRGKI